MPGSRFDLFALGAVEDLEPELDQLLTSAVAHLFRFIGAVDPVPGANFFNYGRNATLQDISLAGKPVRRFRKARRQPVIFCCFRLIVTIQISVQTGDVRQIPVVGIGFDARLDYLVGQVRTFLVGTDAKGTEPIGLNEVGIKTGDKFQIRSAEGIVVSPPAEGIAFIAHKGQPVKVGHELIITKPQEPGMPGGRQQTGAFKGAIGGLKTGSKTTKRTLPGPH